MNIIHSALMSFIPVAAVLTIIYKIYSDTPIVWSHVLYILFMLLGSIFSFALLLYESGTHNPALSKVCSLTRKTSCAAILSSQASKIFGVSWSVVGTTYFLGSLIPIIANEATTPLCLYNSGNNPDFHVGVCTILHLLPVAYSAPLVPALSCRTGSAGVAVFTSLSGNFYSCVPDITVNDILPFVFSFFITFTSAYFMWLYMRYKRTSDYYRQTLTRQKYTPAVFSALLHKNKKIDFPTDGYGITLGNPDGDIHIIKVCNPYCSHCAAAQPILQNLAEHNRNVKLQMIFAINPDSEYYDETPVDLFLSLAQDGADMEQVLSDWYSSENKDINEFKKKYSLAAKEYEHNKENAKLMYEFCKKMEIIGTPTIFINGHEMPDIYSVNDLQYCLG